MFEWTDVDDRVNQERKWIASASVPVASLSQSKDRMDSWNKHKAKVVCSQSRPPESEAEDSLSP